MKLTMTNNDIALSEQLSSIHFADIERIDKELSKSISDDTKAVLPHPIRQ